MADTLTQVLTTTVLVLGMALADVSGLTPLPNPRRVVTANNQATGIGEVLFNDAPQTQVMYFLVRHLMAVTDDKFDSKDWF